jgi:indolepyruvate ferredoxin oxidoreductase
MSPTPDIIDLARPPVEAGALRSLASLDERFNLAQGSAFLTGAQALIAVLLLQRERDRRAGMSTGGYVSGYRGSPLGTFDQALWAAARHLKEAGIVFDPGVNEDLAATAVWGTQQLDALGPANVDGVFAMWYGKGPGVDRSGDPFKHANYTGTHPRGGVLAVFGDDHPGKSSTVAHQSEQAMAANSIPVLYPSNVEDIVRFGLLGFALSRYAGCWSSLKVVNETIEQTATVDIDPQAQHIALPDPADLLPPEGVHYRGAFAPARDETILMHHRLPLVLRFARANRIDQCTMGDESARFGLVSAGKAYQDTRQALSYLGIDDTRARTLGLALYKVGMVWPLEPVGMKEFAAGKAELFFIEEKAAFVERQAAAMLYNDAARPRIVGKNDEHGSPLVTLEKQLEPLDLALAIAARLRTAGLADAALEARIALLAPRRSGVISLATAQDSRPPYFCSGCPHNTSTNVPEGSFALAGIGCHSMAMFYKARTLLSTQMGGEGMNWSGLHHFTKTRHVFQNLGDGTYYHSGLLALRGAVASKANITYKILYNDAVAMTGGQPVDGPISVSRVARQVLGEGVKQVVLVSDNPDLHRSDAAMPKEVTIRHRNDLDAVQRELREVAGCTVLIYEQTCAAEKRRRRKRKVMVDPPKRLFINQAVCEGCGDCSAQSGCISIEPVETALGRKRAINQSSCNKDYRCAEGFCPSFVTVSSGSLRRPAQGDIPETLLQNIPIPPVRPVADGFSVMVAGIGGTGVITVSAVLAMAAHLEHKAASVYDMTGVAQKNGTVFSHLRVAAAPSGIASQRIGLREADLMLAFDMLAGLADEASRTLDMERSRFLGNDRVPPSAVFTRNPDHRVEVSMLQRKVAGVVRPEHVDYVDATGLATALCGDAVAANTFLLGVAAQKGWLPVGVAAIERALELNGVQVESNRRALRLGRLWVTNRAAVEAASAGISPPAPKLPQGLQEVLAHRTELLTRYQTADHARRYRALVEKIAQAEAAVAPGSQRLSLAVAENLAKLMAYKDEYEVARLHTAPEFQAALAAQFEGPQRLRFNLVPPLLSRRDPLTGQLKKSEYGPWILPAMRLLARLRFVRGTPFDLFGYTAERRAERGLIANYEVLLQRLASELRAHNLEIAIQLAQLPQRIRGYGHVKERSMAEAEIARQALLAEFETAKATAATTARVAA